MSRQPTPRTPAPSVSHGCLGAAWTPHASKAGLVGSAVHQDKGDATWSLTAPMTAVPIAVLGSAATQHQGRSLLKGTKWFFNIVRGLEPTSGSAATSRSSGCWPLASAHTRWRSQHSWLPLGLRLSAARTKPGKSWKQTPTATILSECETPENQVKAAMWSLRLH